MLVGLDSGSLSVTANLAGDANVATPITSLMVHAAHVVWRVDAQLSDGEWLEGPVWSFQVEHMSPPPMPPAPPPPPCTTVVSTTEAQRSIQPGGEWGWMYIDLLTGYPSDWIVTDFIVCVSAYHTAGLGNALSELLTRFKP